MDYYTEQLIRFSLAFALVVVLFAIIAMVLLRPRPKRRVYRRDGETDEAYLDRILKEDDPLALQAYYRRRVSVSDLESRVN